MKKIEIVRPAPGQLNDAGRLILDAFQKEAITASIMNLSRRRERESYFQVIRFKLGLYREAGQPLLAALSGGRIVGMAVLKSPRISIPPMRLLGKALPAVPRMLGLLSCTLRAARMGRLITVPRDLPENHYTLDLLAVERSHRRKGLGGLLLDHAAALCADDRGSSGIYLLTGEEKNRAIYEKFGYGLWETRQADSLIAYHMFKAKPFQI